MSTIKDVAKSAGVSIATVSRVLNKKGAVSPEAEKVVTGARGRWANNRNGRCASWTITRTAWRGRW